MNRPRVICVGLACLDYRFRVESFPPRERRAPVTNYHEALGGPAAAAAQAIARLGGSASLCARRANDPNGRRLAEMLALEGVDVSLFKVVAETGTPVCAVFIRADGERYLFPYWGDLPELIEWLPRSVVSHADAVLTDSRWSTGATAAAQAARESGKPVVVDLDRDTPEAWALTASATHVIADEDMARRVGGVDSLLDRIRRAGAWGAVTLGAKGVASHGGRLPSFQVDVRDSTGAGDVFHGAFALALTEGAIEADALRFASAAGALRCELGEPPRRDEVDLLLQNELPHAKT